MRNRIEVQIIVGGQATHLFILLIIFSLIFLVLSNLYSFRSPNAASTQDGVVSVKRNDSSTAAEVKLELCGAIGFIPSLDDLEAVTNLTKLKHKKSSERRCPIPAGHRTPIPWPKSRIKVRCMDTIIR